MAGLKYVRLMDDTIKVGPENESHGRISGGVKNVKSAGHFEFQNGVIRLYGKSFYYNAYPRPGDSRLIKNFLKDQKK